MLDNLQSTWDDEVQPQPQPRKDMFRDIVYQMWEGGIRDIDEIKNETGYSKSHIRALLRERGYGTSTLVTRDEKEVDAICSEYQAGNKIKDILKAHNMSNNTLYALLDKRGIGPRRASRQVFMDRAIEMYKNDALVRDITNETGVSPVVLYQELANRKMPTRSETHLEDPATEEAVRKYVVGEHMIDIISETGISLNSLYKALYEKKVPLRRNGNITERLDHAVDMYKHGQTNEAIYLETRVGSSLLYKTLRHRGISHRSAKAQGDTTNALELYDKGLTAREIERTSGVSHHELLNLLRKRGKTLRSGLSTTVGPKSVELAIKFYQGGKDVPTIEIETLVSKLLLFSELKKKGIEIRP